MNRGGGYESLRPGAAQEAKEGVRIAMKKKKKKTDKNAHEPDDSLRSRAAQEARELALRQKYTKHTNDTRSCRLSTLYLCTAGSYQMFPAEAYTPIMTSTGRFGIRVLWLICCW